MNLKIEVINCFVGFLFGVDGLEWGEVSLEAKWTYCVNI